MIGASLSHIAFVPLPFGTGNDISRTIGWGPSEEKGEWAASVQTLIEAVCSENYDRLTIWDVAINGQVYKPESDGDKKTFKRLNESGELFKCKMACYFNLGRDAEIVFRVDENWDKTGNRFWNNVRYGVVGAQLLAETAPKLSSYLVSVR